MYLDVFNDDLNEMRDRVRELEQKIEDLIAERDRLLRILGRAS